MITEERFKLKILFMGTPDIAAVSLKALINTDNEIVGVVTQPDKPRGRKQVLTPPDAKVVALENNIPVFQPETLKNGELKPVLEELKPDIIAVVAYGKILPEYVLGFPRFGCVNMHGSLLPKYRGAAPIQWSVINGDEKTGVTTMLMNEGLDTGDMLISKEVKIGKYETSGELFDRLAVLGAEVLIETIESIENIKPVPQDDEKATYAPMLKKEMALIDWNKGAKEIIKHICGMNPWPVAYTMYNGEAMKIFACEMADTKTSGKPGEVLGYEKNKGLLVKCGEGAIYINEIQAPTCKRMSIDDYLKGNIIENKTIFG